jgi:hypothetical protein
MVRALSILLLAVGALLWALDRGVGGVEGSTIGTILVALGGVGLLGSVLVSARGPRDRKATEGLDDDRMTAIEAEENTEDETWPLGGHRRPPSP